LSDVFHGDRLGIFIPRRGGLSECVLCHTRRDTIVDEVDVVDGIAPSLAIVVNALWDSADARKSRDHSPAVAAVPRTPEFDAERALGGAVDRLW
jgi:hypothetical protein